MGDQLELRGKNHTKPSTLGEAYQRARGDFVIVPMPAPDILRLSGSSCMELLHRISTNDVRSLEPDHIQRTILTTPLARIVDVVSIIHLPGWIHLLATRGWGVRVHEWLKKHIFFKDDVRIEDDPHERESLLVLGPTAAEALKSMSLRSIPLKPGGVRSLDGTLIWRLGPPLAGFQLLLDHPPETLAKALDALERAPRELYEILRIEAGLPEMGKEITEESIPLEVGLRPWISFEKGCYTGQEIIARMDARGASSKRLVGIYLENEAPPGSAIQAGEDVIGTLTSAAFSPQLGWIGLGIVSTRKMNISEDTLNLKVGGALASFSALPFT